METTEFFARLAEIFDIPVDTITDNRAITEEDWDSLAAMAVMAAIDEIYDVVVPVKEIVKSRTIGDLLRLVAAGKSS
ncbi:MAG: acyl carrier protein [Schwartzia sp.]|nr:acyl carrier protein [Schwartzia sp. (in: firmicutes)]